MAAKKKRTSLRGKTKAPTPTNTKVKALSLSIESAKYHGYEREYYDATITDANRKVELMKALNWYSYNYGPKEAKQFIADHLLITDRKADSKAFKKVSEYSFPQGFGWMARMVHMGWPINKVEQQKLDEAITAALAKGPQVEKPKAEGEEEKKANKPNIQERMREITAEAGGAVEALLDKYIEDGAKARHNLSPIAVLKTANLLPAHVGGEIAHWESVLKEFQEAYKGGDKELKEAYSGHSKIQLRNIIKFIETIIADYHGYVAFKKAARAPRKRKVKTPQQLAAKLKYLKEAKDLKLTSEKSHKIVGAKEVFAYDVKKRKLIYFVADEYAGTLTVKNNSIVGFDVSKSGQKTVRKPAEQLKEFMAASRPNTRKLYANTKAVEVRHSGRFNENIIILKVW